MKHLSKLPAVRITRLYSRREEGYVHPDHSGDHLISHKTSYYKILKSLESARLGVKCLYRFEIWQASRRLCCQGAYRIAKRQKIKHRFCAFETLWDLKIRRFMGYWHVPCFIGVLQILINEIWYMWNMISGSVDLIELIYFSMGNHVRWSDDNKGSAEN